MPGISMSLSGVTCLEDFAAEMEEVSVSILLKELAEKAGVGELWCFFCLCFMK